MFIGGQAVLLYGEPRLTRDVGVTVGTDVSALTQVLAVAHRTGLTPRSTDPEKFAAEIMVLPCEASATGIRVDFVFSTSAYEVAATARDPIISPGRIRTAHPPSAAIRSSTHPRA